jgi:rod shape-determining protein MreC
MNAISATRRTIRREWTTWGALLILSVGLMGVSDTPPAHDLQSGVNWAVGPVESLLSNGADTAGSYWSALTQIDRLRTQNEQLRQENDTLKEQLYRMPAISKMNDDWTKITAEQQSVPYLTTAARVVVRDISDVRGRTIILDQGSDDGLIPGQVVIDAGGALVGRISEVDATRAKVLLVNDTTAVVVGKEAKSGAIGTIRGNISGLLQMSYVDSAAQLTKGEAVLTAGESLACTNDKSPYPPTLLIGTILEISSDPNAVVKSAVIQPAAHLSDATFVLVILNYKGGFGDPLPTAVPAPSGSGSPSPGGGSKPPATPRPSGSIGAC